MIHFFKRSFNKDTFILCSGLLAVLLAYAVDAGAHGVTAGDKGYIQGG